MCSARLRIVFTAEGSGTTSVLMLPLPHRVVLIRVLSLIDIAVNSGIPSAGTVPSAMLHLSSSRTLTQASSASDSGLMPSA
jgi:hypothetical protein